MWSNPRFVLALIALGLIIFWGLGFAFFLSVGLEIASGYCIGVCVGHLIMVYRDYRSEGGK